MENPQEDKARNPLLAVGDKPMHPLLEAFMAIEKRVVERCANLLLNEITSLVKKYGYDLDDPFQWPITTDEIRSIAGDIEIKRISHTQAKQILEEKFKGN